MKYFNQIRNHAYKHCLVFVAFLSCAGFANAATLNEWLFDAPPTGAAQFAVNEVAGGTVVSEQIYAVSYQNLQVAGGPFYSTVGGQALSLASGANYAGIGGANFINWSGRTSFTIELWVDPASGSSGLQDVFSDHGQLLRLAPTTGGYDLTGYIYDGGYHSATGGTVIPANVWTHIALTYDGSTISTYVGSALDGQASYSTSSLASDGNGMGIGTFGGGDFFKGYVDEARESDVALLPGDGSGNGTLAWNASLALVPEPSAVALAAVGLSGLIVVLRRRGKTI